MTRECRQCKGPIPLLRRGRCCSLKCESDHREAERIRRRTRNCKYCGASFVQKYSNQYCGPECQIDATNQRTREQNARRKREITIHIPGDSEQRCIDALARLEARQRREDEFAGRPAPLPRQRSLADAERLAEELRR